MRTDTFKHGPRTIRLLGTKGTRGTAAVEFALILPLLLVLVFGIIEFSLLLYDQAVITNASREGARFGIVVTEGTRRTVAEIEAKVNSYTESRLVSFDSGVTPTPEVPSGPCAASLNDLRVTVTYDYHFLIFPDFVAAFFGAGPGNTIPLSAQTTMMCE